jgi:hypothetical protein
LTLIIGNLNHPNMDSFKKDKVILSFLLSTKIPTFWNIIGQCTQIGVHKLLSRCIDSWWNNNSFLSRTTFQHCLLPLKLTRIILLKQRINMSHKFHLLLKEFIPTFKHLNCQNLVVMYALRLLSLRRQLFMSFRTP